MQAGSRASERNTRLVISKAVGRYNGYSFLVHIVCLHSHPNPLYPVYIGSLYTSHPLQPVTLRLLYNLGSLCLRDTL